MNKMKRLFSIIILSGLILLMSTSTGCIFNTKIGDILAEPSQYEGKTVTIRGTVGDTAWFAVVDKGAYQVGDSSGTIWVITNQPPPEEGKSISPAGKVTSAFSIAGQSYGTVLEETQR